MHEIGNPDYGNWTMGEFVELTHDCLVEEDNEREVEEVIEGMANLRVKVVPQEAELRLLFRCALGCTILTQVMS